MDAIQADECTEWRVGEEQIGYAEARLCQTVQRIEAEVRVAVFCRLRPHVRVHLRHSRVDRVHVARRQNVVGGTGHIGTSCCRRSFGQECEYVAGHEDVTRAQIAVEAYADAEGEQ